jgi:LacI family transcriptional regulator
MGLTDYYEHGIARGVVSYARGRPDWDLYGYGWMFQAMGSLETWDGDGIIARIEADADAAALAGRGIPVVDVAGAWMRPGLRLVTNDDAATGRLAGRHLAGLGRRHQAFCGVSRVGWSRARREAFRAAAAAPALAVYEKSLRWWERLHRSEAFDRWLAGLPRPASLFACNDTVGLKTAAACRRLGLAVPDDIAILGVDNEDILCELSVPALSSIALDLEGIGLRAAAALAAIMDGRPPRATPVAVPPREVVERASTRAVTTGDEIVDRALGVIRDAGTRRLTVRRILVTVPCSRRTLEKRFRAALGHGIHQELIMRRVEAARRLLRETNRTIAAIASETGFANAQRFYVAFRKVQGSTPGAYRRSYRF